MTRHPRPQLVKETRQPLLETNQTSMKGAWKCFVGEETIRAVASEGTSVKKLTKAMAFKWMSVRKLTRVAIFEHQLPPMSPFFQSKLRYPNTLLNYVEG